MTRQNPSWISGGGDMISTTRETAAARSSPTTAASRAKATRRLVTEVFDSSRTEHAAPTD
ncbi:hypothetical protein [Streptomyces chartreusis]|uniref:hypothetical protein n=1 Tax=Streptomyces chartreusis TaxID=1969 RepID=UPI0033B460D6